MAEIHTERWGILYCPKQGLMRPQKRWEKIERCLRENNIEYDFIQSENVKGVPRLVNMLVNNGYRTIIIVGGDSALNDAINCIMEFDKTVRESIALGVIPNGILNDFARYWGYKENEIEQTVKWLKDRRIRKIDLGCLSYTDKEGKDCRRYFLNCVNIGFIASVMNLKQQARSVLGSRKLSFLVSLVLLIFQRMEYRMQLKINNDTLKRKVMTMCIGNASGYGQTPSAVPYNGLLDVSVVCHPGLTQLFEAFCLLITGKFLNHRSVLPYRTRNVEIIDSNNALVGVDGRLVSQPVGKFSVAVRQEVVNFIIPGK